MAKTKEEKVVERSFLKKMGIVGWESKEPLIISALLANKAVMLEGLHGTAKTIICALITESFLGGKDKFRYFNCPIATEDELLGFMNPEEMAKGKIKFIETPTSVWGGNGVLMDEINRAHPGIQGKFMEMALSGSINGMKTGIKFRFAAVNPPDKYLTDPMDLANLSRYSVIQVPSLAEINEEDSEAVEKISKAKPEAVNYTEKWKKMKALSLDKEIETLIDMISTEVIKKLVTPDVSNIDFSGRQANDLRKLYVGFYKYLKFTERDWDEEKLASYMTNIALSVIPECSNLVEASLMQDRNLYYTLVFETIRGIFDNIQSLQGQKELFKLIKSNDLEPEGVQRILSITNPSQWKGARANLPKNKTWKRINAMMAGHSLWDGIDLNNYTRVKECIDDYKKENV